jgi:hypothetical protein
MLKIKANRAQLLNILTFQFISIKLPGTQFGGVGFHGRT